MNRASSLDRWIGRAARWLQQRLEPLAIRGNARYCPVCDSEVAAFRPMADYFMQNWMQHGFIRSPFAAEMLNLVEFSCPRCNASDRSRLYAHYFKNALETLPKDRKHRFIDFAPSGALSTFLRNFLQLEYRTADLFMEGVDDRVDLCEMKIYADQSVDIFLCSHILEHVPDDRKALRELRRILKPSGFGVLVVPINLGNEDVEEDPSLADANERWRRFGQDDHVRSYSKAGWLERVEESGFAVEQLGVAHFGKKTFSRLGLVDRSVLYVVRRAPETPAPDERASQ